MIQSPIKNNAAILSTWFNYGLLIAIFSCNFLSYPGLKYVYVIYGIFVLAVILTFDFRATLPVLVSYSFIEGQGRILWNYHPVARIAFDSLIVIATLRSFVVTRDLNLRKILPLPMLILIFFHFGWYLVELFNLNSINLFAAFAGTKVYIFPFFLFVYFRKNDSEFDAELFRKLGNLIIFLLVCECALGLYQLQIKESMMLAISPFYFKAMSGEIFTKDFFRPFGTTQLPGAISVFIFLTSSIFLIRKEITKLVLILMPILISLFVITLIICQVRSAALKFSLVFIFSWIMIFYTSPQRYSLFFKTIFSSIIILPILVYFFYPRIQSLASNYLNLAPGMDRWEGISEVQDVASQRTGFTKAVDLAIEKLQQFPLGIGPAMTGAAGGLSADLMKTDPVFTKSTFWGYDNFYLSLIIEFGYGFIFYLGFILLVPYYLTIAFIKVLKQKNHYCARIIGIGLVNIFVILTGNWGAIGISYNPESFYFWFWAAVGFNGYALALKENHDPV